ncbi:hypothetical protein J5N97_020603 [Dioscorea zingiberensis]|uniref:Cell wall hydroxyproline-rich glycoprotein n=1 Tax=Dioscorea zingiberensis TaxID=325984 RepID=A0A9D5CGX0_9LILI|nr:hypothetical protein J5N97_020603 [Dioscorea zingiberensis]
MTLPTMEAFGRTLPFLVVLLPSLFLSASSLSDVEAASITRRQLLTFHNSGDLPADFEFEFKVDFKFKNPRLRRAYIALQAWKQAIHSDPYNFTGNWVGYDVCSYNGVFCSPALDDPSLQVVSGVDLNGADIAGYIPAELGLLTDAALIHLNSNRFCGVIPQSFSRLSLLHELDLSNNRFVGKFPNVLISLPALHYLDLRFNEFEGALPWELFDKDLDALFLNDNRFDSSCLPLEIGSLANVSVLDLGSNSFTGVLPRSFVGLKSVQQLGLAHNVLTGVMPEEICRLPQLTNLTFSDNYFKGEATVCLTLATEHDVVFDDKSNCLADRPSQRDSKTCAKVVNQPVDCGKSKCASSPNSPPTPEKHSPPRVKPSAQPPPVHVNSPPPSPPPLVNSPPPPSPLIHSPPPQHPVKSPPPPSPLVRSPPPPVNSHHHHLLQSTLLQHHHL